MVIKTVLGLLLLLALAFLGGHPRVRGLERAVGVSRVMAAGLPFVLLGFIMRHPAVKVLTDSVLDDLDPVLLLGLGWIGFVMGFRTDTRVFEEVTAGVKQLVLGRALAAGILIAGSTIGLLYFFGHVRPHSLTDPTLPSSVTLSDDGKLLVIPTELAPGSLEIYDLTNPAKPRALARFTSPNIQRGVHTAEVQRVNGTLYAFLSANAASSHPSRLVIVDLSDPTQPREVMFRDMGNPFIHDVYVRDGILFTALWNDGMVMWDIGGGGKGGTIENPVEITRLLTVNGEVHNIWWLRDATTGAKRYAIIGEEGAARLFDQSSGDIHVVDLETLAAPREVAFFSVAGAGTHNFSVDEARGFLYAAYYNAGVHVLLLDIIPPNLDPSKKADKAE